MAQIDLQEVLLDKFEDEEERILSCHLLMRVLVLLIGIKKNTS